MKLLSALILSFGFSVVDMNLEALRQAGLEQKEQAGE